MCPPAARPSRKTPDLVFGILSTLVLLALPECDSGEPGGEDNPPAITFDGTQVGTDYAKEL